MKKVRFKEMQGLVQDPIASGSVGYRLASLGLKAGLAGLICMIVPQSQPG